jgi:hypothetical protein
VSFRELVALAYQRRVQDIYTPAIWRFLSFSSLSIMTANEDMSIKKTDFVFDLKVSEEDRQYKPDGYGSSEQTLHQVWDSRWSHHEDYDTLQQRFGCTYTLLKLARVATRSNLFILTSGYYKTLWTTSRIRKNPTWRSGSRKDEEKAVPKRLIVCSELHCAECT